MFNVTIIEQNTTNVTFNLYGSNKEFIKDSFYASEQTSNTFTSISNGVYYYNVTVCDTINVCNTTETRKITIDYVAPDISRNSPSNFVVTKNSTINFSWNATDLSPNANAPLISQIYAYYALDNNSDVTGNGYDLTNRTGTYAPGKIGNGIIADWIFGQGSKFNNWKMNYTDNFTYCYWLYTNTTFRNNSFHEGLFGTMDSFYETQNNNWVDRTGMGALISHTGVDTGQIQQFAVGGDTPPGGEQVNDNIDPEAWTFRCLVRNLTGLTMYNNGAYVSHFGPQGTYTGNQTAFIIGALTTNGSRVILNFSVTPDIFIKTMLDEIGVWSYALNDTEIDYLYNGGTGRTYPFGITSSTFINGSGLKNSTITIYNQSNAVVNRTVITAITDIFSFIFSIPIMLADGVYNWFVDAWDYSTNYAFTNNRTLTVDTTAPSVIIVYPINTTYADGFVTAFNTSTNITWKVSDENSGLESCWYTIDGGTATMVTCEDNVTFTPMLYGGHNITFYANDTAGNIGVADVLATWKFIMRSNTVSYSSPVPELSFQTFVLNVTLDNTITGISMNFIYDNVNYPSVPNSDGINTLFINTITTPEVSQDTNVSFNWNTTASDGSNTFTSTSAYYNQTVTPVVIGQCNDTLTDIIYNFTAYDEDSLQRVDPFYFGGTFSYSINGTNKKDVTFSNVSKEMLICFSPPYLTLDFDVYVTYDEDNNLTQFYNARNYVLQNHLKDNKTQDVFLYLLNATRSSTYTFTLKVQDSDLVPLQDYVINTYRWDPTNGSYYQVQAGKTDANGITSGFFEVNDVDYKFIITHNDVVVLETEKQKVIPQTQPYTLVFTIDTNASSALSTLINVSYFNYSFQNTSTGVTFSYTDLSGNFSSSRLLVYRINYSGQNILVCNTTSALSIDNVPCNFLGVNGTYMAMAYLTRNGIEQFIASYNLTFPYDVLGWGLYGVMLGFFLILVSAFAFRFNEIAGIWIVTLTIIFVNIIGLVNFGITAITAIIGLAIILTVVMKQ